MTWHHHCIRFSSSLREGFEITDTVSHSIAYEGTTSGYPSPLDHERRADGVVHLLGLALVTIASLTLFITSSFEVDAWLLAACLVYCVALIACFAASASYHLLPWHHHRPLLKRIDHVAIYALIAGTFTPLLVRIGTVWALTVLALIWLLALPAMAYKLFGANTEPKWSLASYLGLGWTGMFAVPEFSAHLSFWSITAIFVGGIVYSSGTYFYAKRDQAYRCAIWHLFVLAGTVFLFFAVWTTVMPGEAIANS